MNARNDVKHFLDTSVVRSLLLGTKAYQQYFESQLDPPSRYISPFIAMEIKRSYLRNVIKFYFTLRLPTLETVADAITFWSNHFQGSKHKAIEQLVAQLLTQEAFSNLNPLQKDQALAILEAYLRQFITALMGEFTHLDSDSTECTRASVPLFLNTSDFAESLKAFIDEFDDLQTCREQCRIAEFLLEDYKLQLENYLSQAELLSPSTESGYRSHFS